MRTDVWCFSDNECVSGGLSDSLCLCQCSCGSGHTGRYTGNCVEGGGDHLIAVSKNTAIDGARKAITDNTCTSSTDHMVDKSL